MSEIDGCNHLEQRRHTCWTHGGHRREDLQEKTSILDRLETCVRAYQPGPLGF